MIEKWARNLYVGAAWLFALGVVVQVFLAGMGVFAGAANWVTHVGFGYTIGWLFLILIVAGVMIRIPPAIGRWLAALVAAYLVQTILPALRGSLPAVAALHAVNASIVLLVALLHARRAGMLLREGGRRSRTAPQPAGAARH